jgi:glycolate oxidase
LIIAPVGDDVAKERAKIAFYQIVADCLSLSGTARSSTASGDPS